ncbi:MAG: hypothetical protein ACP5E4_03710, partial [Candidatus Aenigmatarchaeota archaeon]
IIYRKLLKLNYCCKEKKIGPLMPAVSVLLTLFISLYLVNGMVFANDSLYKSADNMATAYGSGISPNWAESMAWLKENSPECTVVATYWDPGYWIAAYSGRRTVYDGGTQNNVRYTAVDDLNGLDCMKDRQGYIITGAQLREICNKRGDWVSNDCPLSDAGLSKEFCVTSRMQDMAGVIYSSDEVWAAKVLESYMGDCNELYFLASNDLIGKSQWWTYFSNWNPETGKGTAYPYSMAQISDQKELLLENGMAYYYGPFILKVTDVNGSQKIEPLLYEQGKYFTMKRMVLYQNSTPIAFESQDAQVPGTLWVDPTFNTIIYMPPQIENSLFTRTFFYGGEGLKYFEPSHLNPEVKLFRFKVDEFREDLEAGLV